MEKTEFKNSELLGANIATMFTMFLIVIVLGQGLWRNIQISRMFTKDSFLSFSIYPHSAHINIIAILISLILAYIIFRITFYIAKHLGVWYGFGGWEDRGTHLGVWRNFLQNKTPKTKMRISIFHKTHKWRGYWMPIDAPVTTIGKIMKNKIFMGLLIIISLLVGVGVVFNKYYSSYKIEQQRIAKLPQEPNLQKDLKPIMDKVEKKFKIIQVDAGQMIGKKALLSNNAFNIFEYYYLTHKNELLILKAIIRQREISHREFRTNYYTFYSYKGWIGRELNIWNQREMVRLKDGSAVSNIGSISSKDLSVEPWLEGDGLQNNGVDYEDLILNCRNSGCDEINYQGFMEKVDQNKPFATNNERIVYRDNIERSDHPVAVEYRNRDKSKPFFYSKSVFEGEKNPIDGNAKSLEIIKK